MQITDPLLTLYTAIMLQRPNRSRYAPSPMRKDKLDKLNEINVHTLHKCGFFGKGTYASVYRVSVPGLDYELAFKQFKDPDCQSAIRELYTMTTLSHSCIVAPSSVVTDARHRIVGYLMPAALTTLAHFADCCPSPPRPLQISILMRAFALDLIEGLHHLHQSGFLHRDIKPDNILVIDGVAKLADLGLATVVGTGASSLNTGTVQTHHFRAPELWCLDLSSEQVIYGTEVDVYALGVTFLDLFLGNKESSYIGNMYLDLHILNKPAQRLQEVAKLFHDNSKYVQCPSPYSSLEQALVIGMVNPYPPSRITTTKALTMFGGPTQAPEMVYGLNTHSQPNRATASLTPEQTTALIENGYSNYEATDRLTELAGKIMLRCGGATNKHVNGSLNIANTITDYYSPELDGRGHDVLRVLICGKRSRGIDKRPRVTVQLTRKTNQREAKKASRHVIPPRRKSGRKGRRVRVRE